MNTSSAVRGRVELHVHIDGAVRVSTIYELTKEKGFPLPGDGSYQALLDHIVADDKEPSFSGFFRGFAYIIRVLKGDAKAIERVAYELCQDQMRNGVLYFEGRYSPHILSDEYLSPAMVVEAINRGLKRGEIDFKIKARSILCCIIGHPEWCDSVVQLCDEYRHDGVVGMDIAGDETKYGPGLDVKIPSEYVKAYLNAEKLGIHRTMHAGEVGSYVVVEKALDELHAERIGHGYHVLDNLDLYKKTLKNNVHFEMCPRSSLLTSAVTKTTLNHPLIQLARDGANFSINSDDPAITNAFVSEDIKLVQQWDNNEVLLIRAAFNAAKSCFLPEKEKLDLIRELKTIYGVPNI